MKSALVLGLALAANAQVDNELATSWYNPSNPSGADLVRNAGWGRHLPIPNRPTYSRFDEAADDELATSTYTPYNPSGADLVRNAGWGRHLPIPNRPTYSRFDEATDDQLLVNLWSPSGADLANHRGRPDTDKHGRPYTDMRGNPLGRPVYRDDIVDDELATSPYTPYNPSGADLVRNAGWGRHLPIPSRPTFSRFDEAADDELATSPYTPYNPSGADLVRNAGWGRHLPIPSRPTFSRFDEATDDELLVNLWSPSGADLANHRGRPDTDKHGRPYTDMRGNPLGRPVYRDDEVDDELAYLVHLIKETQPEKIQKKPEIKRHFRSVEKN